MPEVKLTLPMPHVAQQQVIDEAKRFNVLCCGRRFGKTELGMDRLIQPALRGKPTGWYAPSYKLAAPVFRELQLRLDPVTKDVNQQERRIELKGGGVIEVWSLDSPDSGRGRAYAEVVIDEAALIPHLQRAWQESIRPQLTDYRGGAWFLSTPKGVANEFHALYQRGQDPTQVEWASWQMPTSANPYMPPEEMESAREDMTDLAFAQEYLAAFVSWEGAVFRRILDAVAEPIPNSRAIAMGADWSRTTDYTVLVAIDIAGRVIAIDRFRGLEYAMQRARLQVFWERVGRPFIVSEHNNMGGPLNEQLHRDGFPIVPFTTTNQTKSAIIEALALAFERGIVKIPNNPVLIGELQAFEAKPTPSGMTRYAAPEGMHDDTVMALAIAWQGLALHGQHQEQQQFLARARQRPEWTISPI